MSRDWTKHPWSFMVQNPADKPVVTNYPVQAEAVTKLMCKMCGSTDVLTGLETSDGTPRQAICNHCGETWDV